MYLHAFNYPLPEYDWEHIREWSWEGDFSAVRYIFSQMNGMRVFGNHFVVPGQRISSEGLVWLDFFNIPIDIRLISGYTDAPLSPEKGTVVGNSIRYQGDKERRLYDLINSQGSVFSGYFDESSDVVECFDNFNAWIRGRISGARESFLEAVQDSTNCEDLQQ